MKRKKPLYLYEIGIPVSEYWVMQVEATSIKEAIKRIRDNHDSVDQVCSLSAPVGCARPRVYKKVKL
jgi:hypothetical protein